MPGGSFISKPGPEAALTRRRSGTAAVRLLSGAASAAALAACGPFSPAPSTKKTGPVTVTYMSNLPQTHPEGATRLQLLEEFNSTNTEQITVRLDDGRSATNLDKAKAMAAAGTPPDLLYVAYREGPELLVAGATVDLDAELKTEKDWARQRADIFPSHLESSMWAGKLSGMPAYTNDVAMIYNPGLLQQAGVAPPKQGWTWDDFKTIAQKFVRPGMIPLSLGWWSYAGWLGTTGARPISKDSRKITVDTPEMLQVMELWLEFLKRGIAFKTPDGKAGLTETYQLAKNDTVFEVQGPYRLPTLRQKGAPTPLTTHIPVHPVKKQIAAPNGGHNIVIFKEVPLERRHAAAVVAKWMNAPHAQAQMCIHATSIPVSKAALDSKELQDYAKTDAAFKGFVDLAPYGWRWPGLPSYVKITGAVQSNVDAIMREEIGAKAGLTKAQQEAQLLLDKDVKLMTAK